MTRVFLYYTHAACRNESVTQRDLERVNVRPGVFGPICPSVARVGTLARVQTAAFAIVRSGEAAR